MKINRKLIAALFLVCLLWAASFAGVADNWWNNTGGGYLMPSNGNGIAVGTTPYQTTINPITGVSTPGLVVNGVQITGSGGGSGTTVFTSGLSAPDARIGASRFVVSTDQVLTTNDLGKTYVVAGVSPVALTFTMPNLSGVTPGWLVTLADGVPDSGVSIVGNGSSVWAGVGTQTILASSVFFKPGAGNTGWVTQLWETERAGIRVIKVIDPNSTYIIGRP